MQDMVHFWLIEALTLASEKARKRGKGFSLQIVHKFQGLLTGWAVKSIA